MNEPIMIYEKVERTTTKITLPKVVEWKVHKEYYMEIYEDKIVLIPIRKEIKCTCLIKNNRKR